MIFIVGLALGFGGAVVLEIMLARNGIASNYTELIRQWITRNSE